MTNRVVAAAIAFCLLLQLHLVFVQPINWDEFRFLADVHAHARGELSAVLLTFQVHLFGWVTGLGDEIDQIRIARLVMLALEAGTLALIWTIARRFFEPAAALVAALGYVSFSFVLQHGASFRFDPIATFLLMLSVALLLRERLRWAEMAAVGLALALAMMVTVKTVLALPLVVAVGLYRLLGAPDRRDAFLRLGLAAVSSVLFLVLLYFVHLASLAGASSAGAQAHLTTSYGNTLADIPFLPQRRYLLRSLLENPVHWLLLLLGLAAVIAGYAKARGRALLLLAFLLPLLGILFYRNAYPYFYALVLAPASLFFAAAVGREELRKHAWVIALVMAGAALVHHQAALSDAATDQRRTVAAIHEMFPEPVPYLDRCSMIASFPQAGVFLSTMALGDYLQAGRPMMRDLLATRRPVFLIANSPQLEQALGGGRAAAGEIELLPADRAVLRDNFVRHWGPIYVAGKAVAATPAGARFEMLVPGPYTVSSNAPIAIDDRAYRPGAVATLSQGVHVVRSSAASQIVELRWGNRLRRPIGPEPQGPMFGRF